MYYIVTETKQIFFQKEGQGHTNSATQERADLANNSASKAETRALTLEALRLVLKGRYFQTYILM